MDKDHCVTKRPSGQRSPTVVQTTLCDKDHSVTKRPFGQAILRRDEGGLLLCDDSAHTI